MARFRSPSQKDSVPWPSLRAYGLALKIVSTKLGQELIVPLSNGVPVAKDGRHHDLLIEAGFKFVGGVYGKGTRPFLVDDFKRVFPKLEIMRISDRDLRVTAPAYASSSWKIGRNHRNEDVYLDFNAKRAVHVHGKFVFENDSVFDPIFLRIKSDDGKSLDEKGLSLAIQGFVRESISHTVSDSDMLLFCSSLWGERVDKDSKEYQHVAEALRFGIMDYIKEYKGDTKAKFELALLFEENMRNISAFKMVNVSSEIPIAGQVFVASLVERMSLKEDSPIVLNTHFGTGSLSSWMPDSCVLHGVLDKGVPVRVHGSSVLAPNTQVSVCRDGSVDMVVGTQCDPARFWSDVMLGARKASDKGSMVFVAAGMDVPLVRSLIEQAPRLKHMQLIRVAHVQGESEDSSFSVFRFEGGESLDVEVSFAELNSMMELWGSEAEHHMLAGGMSQDQVAEIRKGFSGSLQSKYFPKSALPMPQEALIPSNMAGPVFEALESLEKKHGNVDAFVMSKLHMDFEQLKSSFSAGQVDAIALGISRFENESSLILGDQTGFGKGRTLAGLARYAILEGKKVLFMTEKANLFTDIVRDCEDIGSLELLTPFILNAGKEGNIFNQDGECVLRAASQKEDRTSFCNLDGLPDKYNIILATYSQVNRLYSNKALALENFVAEQGLALLDESHNAAGQSNIFKNIERILGSGTAYVPTVFSSATAIKNHKNLDIYIQSMSLPYSGRELVDAAKRGGESFLQVFSTMLASHGGIIRRETSFDGVDFVQVLPDAEKLAENVVIAGDVSEILQRFVALSKRVEQVVFDKVSKIEQSQSGLSKEDLKQDKRKITYLGAGGTIHHMTRQLMLGLRAGHMIEDVVKDLDEGLKPIVSLEQTMDSLIGKVLEDVEPTEDGAYVVDGPVSMGDSLLDALDGLMYYHEKDRDGNSVKTRTVDPGCTAYYQGLTEHIGEAKKVNSLPVAIFDELHNALEQAGYSASEVSGRKWGGSFVEGVGYVYRKLAPLVRNRETYNFQNDVTDAIVVSGAGATGISLHAAPEAKAQGRRTAHVLQSNEDSAKVVQFFGRGHRTGQTSAPIIKVHRTSLAGEEAEIISLASKVRLLTSAATGNRKSSFDEMMGQGVDMVNEIGDKATADFLAQRPDIGEAMGINGESVFAKITEGTLETGTLAKRFLGRSNALAPKIGIQHGFSVEDMDGMDSSWQNSQEYALGSVKEYFETRVRDLEKQGVNPFDVKRLDWSASRVRRQLYSGSESAIGSKSFDEPCFIEEFTYQEERRPIRFDDVLESVVKHRALAKSRHQEFYGDSSFLDYLSKNEDNILLSLVPDYVDKHDLKKMVKEIPVLAKASENIDKIKRLFSRVQVGSVISMVDTLTDDERARSAIITNISFPRPEVAHRLGSYHVHMVFPGDASARSVSGIEFEQRLRSIVCQGKSLSDIVGNPLHERLVSQVSSAYATHKGGSVEQRRVVITGNMVEACMLGAGCLSSFTLKDGSVMEGFVLPLGTSFNEMVSRGVKERCSRTIKELLDKGHNDLSNMRDYDSKQGILLKTDGCGVYELHVPLSKVAGEMYFNDPLITDIVGEFSKKSASYMVSFSAAQFDSVMHRVVPLARGFHMSGHMLKAAQEIKRVDIVDLHPSPLSV